MAKSSSGGGYPFIFMDAIHYKMKVDHRYVTKAVYVVLGITMNARKTSSGCGLVGMRAANLGSRC